MSNNDGSIIGGALRHAARTLDVLIVGIMVGYCARGVPMINNGVEATMNYIGRVGYASVGKEYPKKGTNGFVPLEMASFGTNNSAYRQTNNIR